MVVLPEQTESYKLNIFGLIYAAIAVGFLFFQMDIGVAKKFGGGYGKGFSSAVLVFSCLALHFLQGPFKQFSNLLTFSIAFYFLANFMPNWGTGAPAFRNAANSADLAPTDVAELAARFLFVSLALFAVLYLVLSFVSFKFLTTAKNAYGAIVTVKDM